MSRVCRCIMVLFVSFWASAGLAQVSVTPGPEVPLPLTAVTAGQVTQVFVLDGGENGGQVVLPETLSAVDGGVPVPLRWMGDQNGAAVPKIMVLKPGETQTLRLGATLPKAGHYEFSLDLKDAGGVTTPLGPYVVERLAGPLPKTFLTDQTRHLSTAFSLQTATCPAADPQNIGRSVPCDPVVVLVATNTTDQPVAVHNLRNGGLRRLGDGAKTGDSLDVAASDIPMATDCNDVVAPGGFCTVTLSLPSRLPAGSYEMKLSLQGTEGDVVATTLTLNLRSPRWLVGLMVAFGAAVGLFIAHWRGKDRVQSLAELPLRLAVEGLRPLAASGHPAVMRAAERAQAAVSAALLQWRQTGQTPALQPDVITGQHDALIAASRALSAVDVLPTPQQAQLAALKSALIQALARDDWAGPARAAALALATAADTLPITEVAGKDEAGKPVLDFDLPIGTTMARVEATLAETLRTIRRMDILTNVAVLGVFWLLGALVPWPLSESWDGFTNLAAAFLAGLALRFALPTLIPRT